MAKPANNRGHPQTSGRGVPPPNDAAQMQLTSEFASVQLSLDVSGNGPRLRLEDLQSGMTVLLDPVQLESLVWLPRADLVRLADPGRRPWGQESG